MYYMRFTEDDIRAAVSYARLTIGEDFANPFRGPASKESGRF
jgi:hypothetical protein